MSVVFRGRTLLSPFLAACTFALLCGCQAGGHSPSAANAGRLPEMETLADSQTTTETGLDGTSKAIDSADSNPKQNTNRAGGANPWSRLFSMRGEQPRISLPRTDEDQIQTVSGEQSPTVVPIDEF